MQSTAPVAEGHRTWREQRLMGSVVPALRLVGNVVLVQPEGRLGFIAYRREAGVGAGGRQPGSLENSVDRIFES